MLRDAIEAHGGESEIVRNRFFDLDDGLQRIILEFIGKLWVKGAQFLGMLRAHADVGKRGRLCRDPG
jgi:hypothetical protein